MEKPQTSASQKICFLLLIQFIIAVFVFCSIQVFNKTGVVICLSETDDKNNAVGALESQVIILLWTWPFGEVFPLDVCLRSYGISGCYLTGDKSWYKQADAVVFHHRDITDFPDQLIREPRPPKQHWIWFNMESPSNVGNLDLMTRLINFTMSYRQDSDIFTPYGWLELLTEPQNFSIPAKFKLVSWVVSNWNPNSRRVVYYDELKKHIQVDIFGRAAVPLDMEKIYTTVSQYKFYLAFENSEHIDYITEKLWRNALLSGTVPVVLGPTRENYERFLPAEAFIHVDDFPVVQELADYLKLLDSDAEKYQRYFDWRRHFRVVGESTWDIFYCKACQYMRQNPTFRTIPSVAKWFS